MKRMLCSALLVLAGHVQALDWQDSQALDQAFARAGATGTFVLHEVGSEQLQGHNRRRAETRYPPASTFKIANSLIGLATGAVASVDEVFPYDGTPPSWGHRLQAAGVRSDSIGKLHYRSVEDEAGFDEEILPLHVLNGQGDIQGMLRSPPPKRPSTSQLAADAGEGESTYLGYDRKIRDAACDWLAEAGRRQEGPWTLFVSFVCPHFPLVAPPEFFRLYPLDEMPMPQLRGPGEFPDHPVLAKLREVQAYEDHFRDEAHIRTAMAAYYGMVSFLDDNVGRVLAALDAAGLADNTLVVFTSDHGEMLGDHGILLKGPMLYDACTRVPLIMRWPAQIPAGTVVDDLVQWIDLPATFLDVASCPAMATCQGASLMPLTAGTAQDWRDFALCEYRDSGHGSHPPVMTTMLRHRDWKLVVWHGDDTAPLVDNELEIFGQRVNAATGTEIVVDGYQAIDGSNRANGRDLTFPDGTHLFMGSSGTGAPLDGRDPTERRQ